MSLAAILPDVPGLLIEQVIIGEEAITLVARLKTATARCPCYAQSSARVHSYARRTLLDLPVRGRRMHLSLQVRRFRCLSLTCPRRTFREQVPGLAAPSARKTLHVQEALCQIAFALGGKAGARLAKHLGLPCSPDTLLRLVRSVTIPASPTPRILGVDDFSFRRGRCFGTILLDLERRVPIDLLPDREALTFAAWLIAHPAVELISRDRGGNYAEGARLGAPHAKQTTDRWHLLKNLGEALESFFLSQKTLLKAALHPPEALVGSIVPVLPWHTGGTTRLEGVSRAHQQQRVERYEQIHALAASHVAVASIARQLGVSRQTVYTELRRTHPPERRRISLTRPRLLAPYEPYLLERWNQGCRNGQQLYREIQARGYPGSVTNVTRFVSQLRYHKGTAYRFKAVEPTPETVVSLEEAKQQRLPTALQVARWMTLTNEQRLDWQNEYLARLCQADGVVARTYDLTQEFAHLLRERQGERLDAWMEQVKAHAIPELRTFVRGLRKDYDAVKNGLTLEWSNGRLKGM